MDLAERRPRTVRHGLRAVGNVVLKGQQIHLVCEEPDARVDHAGYTSPDSHRQTSFP